MAEIFLPAAVPALGRFSSSVDGPKYHPGGMMVRERGVRRGLWGTESAPRALGKVLGQHRPFPEPDPIGLGLVVQKYCLENLPAVMRSVFSSSEAGVSLARLAQVAIAVLSSPGECPNYSPYREPTPHDLLVGAMEGGEFKLSQIALASVFIRVFAGETALAQAIAERAGLQVELKVAQVALHLSQCNLSSALALAKSLPLKDPRAERVYLTLANHSYRGGGVSESAALGERSLNPTLTRCFARTPLNSGGPEFVLNHGKELILVRVG